MHYNNGFIENDPRQAFLWWKKSAKQGNTDAQFKVAECYSTGTGVKEDYEKALAWLKLASKPKLDLAQNTLENDNSTLIQENRELIETVKGLIKDKKKLMEDNTKLMKGKENENERDCTN